MVCRVSLADIHSNSFVIRGGRIIDPASAVDRVDDLIVVDGNFAPAGVAPKGLPVIDAEGLIVCPGLIDMHVHLREPGAEHKETIETGSRAAAAGGFTAVACMPNTTPPMDNPETLKLVLDRAARAGHCRVYPIAAITRGRGGTDLIDMNALRDGGAVAFSDDGDGVEDDAVMRRALQRARRIDALVIQHCEFKSISAGGVMHKGVVSQRLGLPGIDPAAEEEMIRRDIALVRETGARYHVAHISTRGAIELVRRAKAENLPVTAEVCTHHLALTDQACLERDPNTKMHPPLRSADDVSACLAGLVDGTIDCIVTDHAPHSAEEKGSGFVTAPFGIVGLETSLPLAAKTLVGGGRMDWPRLIHQMSTAPAALLGVPGGSLSAGQPADITLIDPVARFRIEPARFRSKSRNTPFGGNQALGRVVATILGGAMTYNHSIEPEGASGG